jgi:hypothetical protein
MWPGIICIIMGLVFGTGGLFAIVISFKLRSYGISTTAILSRIEKVSSTSADGRTKSINCYYTFKHLDGTVYEVKSNSSGMSDYIGKETKIYYDKKYPKNKYCLNSDKLGNLVGAIFGIILLIIGTVLILTTR